MAESLLQAIKRDEKAPKELPESGDLLENGGGPETAGKSHKGSAKMGTPNGSRHGSVSAPSHGKSIDKTQARGASSARDTPDANGSRWDNSGARGASSDVDRRDRRSDVHDRQVRQRLSSSVPEREKVPLEADKRDKKGPEKTSGMCLSKLLALPLRTHPVLHFCECNTASLGSFGRN